MQNFTIDKLISFIYFFLNTLGLPVPVSYTSLLSLVKIKETFNTFKWILIALFCVLSIYTLIHIYQGVVTVDYFKSLSYFGLLLFSGFAAHIYLNKSKINVTQNLQWMSIIALVLFLLGLILLNSNYATLFWTSHQFTGEGAQVSRYKGLSYEPSHLALTLSPIFLFFIWKNIFRIRIKSLAYLMAVVVPIALTFSFGFGAAFLISIILTALTVFVLYQKFKPFLMIPVIVLLLTGAILSLFPNPLSERIEYIAQGKDTSVNGRTVEAFSLAYQCAETKNIWLGIGIGQIKYIGEEVIRPYYAAMDPIGYSKENWPVMSIPNSLAETLAIFGIFGVILKIGALVFGFFYFKVYKNYFNLSLFAFLFVYQMMGSFILSTTEVVMWALAFSKIFEEFDVQEPLNPTA